MQFSARGNIMEKANLQPGAVMTSNPFRKLPSVHQVLETPAIQALATGHPHELIVAAIRQELAELRQRLGEPGSDGVALDHLAARVADRLQRDLRPRLRSVINATGIVLHTNLGRAPMAREAAQAAHQAAGGYLNLELDLDTGKRSSRQIAVREWLCRLTGAESATAVNNNAAATVLTLRALAQGREVILSRGQLIEIGGSFRIPEIMAVSGAILREVGTTNITRLADYERAIGPATAALMEIHPSNYRVRGFSKSVPLPDLVNLGRKHNLPIIDDIGSGALLDFARFGLPGEPVARERIALGADLVLFSGDKLLGGPQAGILVGRKVLIQKIEEDPLMRAFRLDKMTLAALEATLRLYLDEAKALQTVPTLAMLSCPLADLQQRAETLAGKLRALAGIKVQVRADEAYVGGGSLPDQALPTWVVELTPENLADAELARRLRTGQPAVIGRVTKGTLLLDVRTIFPHQKADLVEAIRTALTLAAEAGE
jgi:L-seryl-tRNA(Ser) seleniumtransferase